jgi:hypothetical protein
MEELVGQCHFTPFVAVLVAIAVFLLATFLPFLIMLLRKKPDEKYIERKWFTTVFWASFALFGFLINGVSIINADIYKAIVWIAGIQGFIFTVGGHVRDFQKVSLSFKGAQLNLEKQAGTGDDVNNESNTNKQ